MDRPIIVSVSCLVYNQAPYIRQCLEGIVMQITDFPFEAIVHDDASTDGSTSIIQEFASRYPSIIIPIFEDENQYSKGEKSEAMRKIVPRLTGKYIAMCEGDDFWIDPFKLQKQVAFLESHPEYGMCYSSFNLVDESSGKFIYDVFQNRPEDSPMRFSSPEEFLVKLAYVAPPSWLIRRELYFSVPPSSQLKRFDETFVQFTHFLVNSKVFVFPEPMVTYRVLVESASHSKDFSKKYLYRRSLYDTQRALIDYYHLDRSIVPVCRKSYYKWLIKKALSGDNLSLIKRLRKDDSKRDMIEEFIIFDFSCLRLIKRCYRFSRRIPFLRRQISCCFNMQAE